MPRTSSLTVVLNTIGRSPPLAARWLMYSTVTRAFSGVLMKGSVVLANSSPSNWVNRVAPRVSAVMPVPSETKKTVFCLLMCSSIGTGRLRPHPPSGRDPRQVALVSWAGPAIRSRRGGPRPLSSALDESRNNPANPPPRPQGPATGPRRHQRMTKEASMGTPTVLWFKQLGMHDVELVGGKNSSLGEMIQHLSKAGVSVPDGFATTAAAYREFLAHEGLADRINAQLSALDVDDVQALARTGKQIRE